MRRVNSLQCSSLLTRDVLLFRVEQEGRSAPARFRTIQDWPKDMPTGLHQAEREEDRPQGLPRSRAVRTGTRLKREGRNPHDQHEAARVHHPSRGRGVAWPLRGQPAGTRRIGVLVMSTDDDALMQSWQAAFRKKLDEAGWQDGLNIQLDYRWAAGNEDRLQIFAKELIDLNPDVIIAHTTPATTSVLRQTRSIPIIFVQVTDPIGNGFVCSLNRPGGNATGFMNMEPTMAGKWLELLKEIAPRVTRVALLFNPAMAPYTEHYLKFFKGAASLGVEAIAAPVQHVSELETLAAGQAREPNGGLVVMADIFLWIHRAEITSLVARYGLPTVYPVREWAKIGGLLCYGNDRLDQYQRAAVYADRILKGEKPGQLPVQAPTKFEMAVNLKTAKALGLEAPATLLMRADEVIE